MSKPWKKYTDAFKNLDKIAEGIKNNIFKKEHVEAVFTDRYQICAECSLLDVKGDSCLAPGTQPCCSDCGCSLDFKLRSLSSECPKGYWNSLVSEETEELITKQINDYDTD
tara:strand:+ start:606 stop:938 length:333 start_codon:yes stop_codon:yes gene_type:complete